MLLPLIHRLPFINHSSFTLIPPSISQFCITVHGGFVSRSSICQHPPVGWQSRLGPGDRHQTWDAGLGSPNVCARIGAGLLQDKEKGLPAMTNGYLRINTQVSSGGEGGRRKSAESLFHHPSVSFGSLINLWTMHLPLFQSRTPFSIHCLLWPLCNKFDRAKSFRLFFLV